jgi:hypothetical protein
VALAEGQEAAAGFSRTTGALAVWLLCIFQKRRLLGTTSRRAGLSPPGGQRTARRRPPASIAGREEPGLGSQGATRDSRLFGGDEREVSVTDKVTVQ